jgi:hypothetical protein
MEIEPHDVSAKSSISLELRLMPFVSRLVHT